MQALRQSGLVVKTATTSQPGMPSSSSSSFGAGGGGGPPGGGGSSSLYPPPPRPNYPHGGVGASASASSSSSSSSFNSRRPYPSIVGTGASNHLVLLQDRLEDLRVWEMKCDPGEPPREHRMTVRLLYKYVLSVITDNSRKHRKELKQQKKKEKQQQQQQQQTSPPPPADPVPFAAGAPSILSSSFSNEEPTRTTEDGLSQQLPLGQAMVQPQPDAPNNDPTARPPLPPPPTPPHTTTVPRVSQREEVDEGQDEGGEVAAAQQRRQRQELRNTFGSSGRQPRARTDGTCDDGYDGRGGGTITYRERLGAYIHPRDMRRLVTPYFASNEPEIIVRRHVMLLNFDPIRAIILRDRLLLIVPGGSGNHPSSQGGGGGGDADGLGERIIELLERIMKGDIRGVVDSVFNVDDDAAGGGGITKLENTQNHHGNKDPAKNVVNAAAAAAAAAGKTAVSGGNAVAKAPFAMFGFGTSTSTRDEEERKQLKALRSNITDKSDDVSSNADRCGGISESHNDDDDGDDDEWKEMNRRDWIDLQFELHCLDSILLCVCQILSEETVEVHEASRRYIDRICSMERRGARGSAPSVLSSLLCCGRRRKQKRAQQQQDPLAVLRALKDAAREMSSRVNGYITCLTRVLEEDEDMALMNLTRLVTHPEIFIQPVPDEVLEEESDEPELILEANLQIGLSLKNALDLIDGQVDSASALVHRHLDSARNKLLLANVMLTILTVCLALASLVGSIFGMNLVSGIENVPGLFFVVTGTTIVGCIILFFLIIWILDMTGTLPRQGMGNDDDL